LASAAHLCRPRGLRPLATMYPISFCPCKKKQGYAPKKNTPGARCPRTPTQGTGGHPLSLDPPPRASTGVRCNSGGAGVFCGGGDKGSLVQRELSSVCETEGLTIPPALRATPLYTRGAFLRAVNDRPYKFYRKCSANPGEGGKKEELLNNGCVLG